jgi:hypothetical protein
MINERQAVELTGKGDCREHYHLEDRGPFPISHGYFYDTTSQTIASTTTAYAATLNTTVYSNGVEIVSGSRITARSSGLYNIQFSAQLANSDSQDHDVDIWLAMNGTNITESTGTVSVPAKHGAINGHTLAAWNFFQRMGRGDYVQLMWQADSTLVSAPHIAAQTSPARPSTPSFIVSVNLVSI